MACNCAKKATAAGQGSRVRVKRKASGNVVVERRPPRKR